MSMKTAALIGLIVGGLYYGWPIVEAIILVLPLPADSLEKVKAMAGSATDFVQNSVSGGAPSGRPMGGHDYSANLD